MRLFHCIISFSVYQIWEGGTTTYTYSGTTSPTLVKTELPNGEYIETKYTYDTMGNVTSMTDGEGRKTQYEYDWRGNLTKVTNPQGSAKSSVFDYAANKITLTDENGNTVTYDYDCFGNLEEVKAGNSLLKKCEYDYKNFCLIKETSPDSKTVTSYTYDSACRPVSKITLENGKEIYNETMSYGMENVSQYTKNLPSGKNATGNVVTSVVKGDGVNTQSITTKTVTDYNGNTISQECGGVKKSYEYDAMGNMIKESPYAGYSITYEYDPSGNVLSQTDSTGVTSKKEYDGLGRLVKEYTPKGIAGNYFTQYTYKGFTDMLKSVTIPLDNGQNMVKEYETDKTGKVLKETVVGGNAGNSVTEYTYNEIGLPVTVTAQGNKEANVTTYTYDKVGNKTSMTTGNALSKTIYKYDNLNRLTYLITVPNETKYTPDAAITVFPEHCIEKYEYDVNGNLSKKTDRNGNVITYAYDGLNRLKSQKTGDLEKTAEYALTGAKVKENYGNAELNYKYDARGNLIYEKSSLDGKSFINEYTYDGKNFLNSFKYKNDNTQVAENTYTYTAKGQLEKVYENGNQVAAYSYDLDGNLEKTTYGNNVETAYGYNYAGLVKSVQSKNGTNILDSHSYTYYSDGNQKTKTDNGVVTTYGYDLYGRLISETAGKEKKNYTYDLSGNRTRLAVSGKYNYNTYYNYDAYNRLTRETTNEKGKAERDDTNYYYDYNGNPILISYDDIGYRHDRNKFEITDEVELAGCAEELTYNGFNELVSQFNDHKLGRYYAYRPDGLIFQKKSDIDGTNYYNWQGNNIIAEEEINGNWDITNKIYTRGLGLIKSNEGFYYLQNGHGDVSVLVNDSGKAVTKYTYDAFGNKSYTGAYSNNPFGYCSEYYDPLMGGIYLRARIYNPNTGRFYTEDPVKDGLNWYAYCGNNPVMFKDPTGKIIESDGNFDSYAQRALIYASRDYLYKKLTGDIAGANKIAKKAADFRSEQEVQSWWKRAAYDSEAQYLQDTLNLAFDKANDSGFKRGSDEYAMIVTFYALKNIEIWDTAQDEYVAQLMAYGISMASVLNGQCFTGDTLIKTSDGYKKIKDIKEGDSVLSEDEETGETGYKKVKNTFIRETETLVKVCVDKDIINTTEEHPFYVLDKGWVLAKNLKKGDLLKLADGTAKRVLEIKTDKLETPVRVYNFEVEDWHTYFVSEYGILVHNVCGNFKPQNPNLVNDKYLKRKGIDAHQLKRDYLGNKAEIKKYDIYVDKTDGALWIFKKGGQGMGIKTDEFIK